MGAFGKAALGPVGAGLPVLLRAMGTWVALPAPASFRAVPRIGRRQRP
jgi:hypothetical protein